MQFKTFAAARASGSGRAGLAVYINGTLFGTVTGMVMIVVVVLLCFQFDQ